MIRKAWLLLLLVIASTLPARSSEYMCRRLSIDDGLSQSNVTAIVRDPAGFLWIGSRFGLNRYDFSNIVNYYSDRSVPASIPDNSIEALFVDSRDTLWVAGEKGVAFYCRRTDDFRRVECDKAKLNARSFYDEGNGLLIGGGGALYFYDYASGKATVLQTKGGSRNYYTAIHYWKPGFYVLATRWDGLWLFDRSRATITRLPDCPEKRIMASKVDTQGRLWVSVFGSGVFCYERDGSRSHVLHSGPDGLGSDIVRDIIEKDGEMWFATDGAGINVYDVDKGSLSQKHNGVLNALGAVSCLYVDRHGDVYGGTVRDGAVSIHSVAIRTFESVSNPDMRLSAVAAIEHDQADGNMWIGIDGLGLLFHTEGTSSFSPVEATLGSKVISIADYDNATLAVSTFDKGLILIDKATRRSRPVPEALRAMYEREKTSGIAIQLASLSNGTLALLSDHLCFFDPSRGTLDEPMRTPMGGSIVPFYNDRGVLLFRNTNSIGEYDTLTGTTRMLHSQKERITCAAFDGEHTVYMSTETGVTAFNIDDGTLTHTVDTGMGYISTLVVESNHLWMGCNNALLMRDLTTGHTISFGRHDGVRANEYIPGATLVSDRYIYMGGVNGMVRVDCNDLDRYTSTHEQPSITLADLEIDGQSAYAAIADNRISVDPSHRHLRLAVISDGSHAMGRPHYRFVISGHGRDRVVETFSNFITISALDPGETYDFSVAAILPDGSTGPSQPLLSMAVMAPWYNSRWMWVAVIIIAATSLFMAEWQRRRSHNRRLAVQLEAVRSSSLEKEVAFLVNTNYALRTPLTMIYAPIKMLIERIHNGEQVNLEGELQNIYRNTKRMRDVIDMAMELHQVGTLPEETAHVRRDMRRAIQDALAQHSDEIGNKHIDVSVDAPDTLPDIMLSAPDRMRVVLDILMQNAVRRSSEGSSLRIALRMEGPDTMHISFADHGPLLDDKAMASLFSYSNTLDGNISGNILGLAYASSIIDTLGGRIGAENNPAIDGGGITVWMELPVELASESARKSRHIPAIPAAAPEAQAPLVHVDTSDLTVVVVEEDNDLCMFVSSQLKPHFKRVLHAFNGKDALLMIRQEMPDIVVSSILLPFKSGIELCLDIKSNPDTRHIPVILLTTLKEGPQLESAYGAGADSYLSKPFDMNVLMMRMRNLLHTRDVIKQRYSHTPAPTATTSPAALPNADESFLLKIDRLIADNIENPDFNVDAIARGMHMSRTVLYSKFKALTGTTIAAYINDYRLTRARALLRDTSLTISEISEQLGFSSQRYFSTFFKERTGTTPTAYRTDNT
ncbi:MAG: helix-turn-helix domain-containing protein [Muribaculaceae bacterium]|nr:helix-turn-helix domain-containing protein [Muribaculaceae bacterium]